MRRKVGCLCLAGFVVLLAIGEIPVDAGIRPRFRLDDGLWSATHIVSVQRRPRMESFPLGSPRRAI